ncbi:MAG: NAD(P)H-binding protein, partial [Solirubrobacteraceae bacterium]
MRSGANVRALVRDPARARALEREGADLRRGDITAAGSLEGAMDGIELAYFLVHAMGGGRGYAEREREGARNFARAAARAGVSRVVYLGGLGDETVSAHLRSRPETARV